MYVIGGIVDRTVRKGTSLTHAQEHSIAAKRLPVQEYLPNRQTHILNIDTVFTILWKYRVSKDWAVTLNECVPLRRLQSGGKQQRRLERRLLQEEFGRQEASGDACVNKERELVIDVDRVDVGGEQECISAEAIGGDESLTS